MFLQKFNIFAPQSEKNKEITNNNPKRKDKCRIKQLLSFWQLH